MIDETKIRFLLMEAIYEFGRVRTPAAEYVARRYPEGYLGDHDRDADKIKEVTSRTTLARELHSGLYDIKCEVVKDKE